MQLDQFKINPFHWQLAFPEVFLHNDRTPGFDVVIGNPPYDVLAEKEAGERVGYLKAYIGQDGSMRPSVFGKNNLYKLFICRAIELLRDGGYLSLIVPMPLLGDEQARGIRAELLRTGTFRQIHAFPQKDNVARRVFRDAKLSTAVFVFRKGAPSSNEPAAFPSVRHPANIVDDGSPSLLLRTTEIPLYDPSNFDHRQRLASRLGSGRSCRAETRHSAPGQRARRRRNRPGLRFHGAGRPRPHTTRPQPSGSAAPRSGNAA
jgi:hypothetical protein